MTEREELRIRTTILLFVKRNVTFVGTPEMINSRQKEMTNDLFELFAELYKSNG